MSLVQPIGVSKSPVLQQQLPLLVEDRNQILRRLKQGVVQFVEGSQFGLQLFQQAQAP